MAYAASSVGICSGLGTLLCDLSVIPLDRKSQALARLPYPHLGTSFAMLSVTPHLNYSLLLRGRQRICSATDLAGVGVWDLLEGELSQQC